VIFWAKFAGWVESTRLLEICVMRLAGVTCRGVTCHPYSRCASTAQPFATGTKVGSRQQRRPRTSRTANSVPQTTRHRVERAEDDSVVRSSLIQNGCVYTSAAGALRLVNMANRTMSPF
jgi:hypothetical protein